MTGVEILLLILTIGGTFLAGVFNRDNRKIYMCVIVLAVTVIGLAFFTIIQAPETLYWGVGALELAGVGAILTVFKLPEWKNEGYLLVICTLMLLSAWNTIFYTYSLHFGLYANMADTLALVTVAWMIGRSDDVLDIAASLFGGHGHLPVD